MTREEFLRLAADGYNRIPLAHETLADFDTPLSIYLKLADEPNSYLLESVQGGEKWGRYSIIGLPCRTVMRAYDHRISVTHDGVEIETLETEDPLAFVETFKARYNVPTIPGLPRFNGGLVGYFGYDCVRYVEPRLGKCPNPDPLGVPDILLMVSDAVVVFDNLAGKMHAIVLVDPAQPQAYESGLSRLEQLMEKLRQPITPRRGLDLTRPQAADPVFRSSFTQADYEKAVDTIKEYILAGDCMQVVPSQRMSIDFKAAPIDLYRALRCFNPTPYMYFFNFGDFHVVGSSPEVLVRVEDNLITVRPIAGTRPRGATEEADHALEVDLLSDDKEIAEHLMLIDLGRNDTGRVSEVGSVKLTEDGHRALFQRHAHRLQRDRPTEKRADGDGRAARHSAGGHTVRRAEDSRDGNHRRAGTGQTRRVRRRCGVLRLERQHGHGDCHPYCRDQERRTARAGRWRYCR
jgi:anthranilate synthase component 1